jgi:hypothetical protein
MFFFVLNISNSLRSAPIEMKKKGYEKEILKVSIKRKTHTKKKLVKNIIAFLNNCDVDSMMMMLR